MILRGSDRLNRAAALLRGGGLVVIPTETVYGVCADATNPEAVSRVFAAKGRTADKPLPVLVSGAEDAERFCAANAAARKLMRLYWPGPLTLVLPLKPGALPPVITGGQATVGLRCPGHPVALGVLKAAGRPLVLTSANLSGQPEPLTAEQVMLEVDAVLDGGECAVKKPSHVLDLTKEPPECLRYGAAVIGLTGGSGAGKSVVLNRLRELGAFTINADVVYHGLLETDADMRRGLLERFPSAFANPNAPPDRAKLRSLVFNNPSALDELNRLTHPYVLRAIRRELASLIVRDGLNMPVAIEAIALFESGLFEMCGVTLGVTAPVEERVSRITARDGLSREEALMRIQSQKPNEFYEKRCDENLVNDSSEQELIKKTDVIWRKYILGCDDE